MSHDHLNLQLLHEFCAVLSSCEPRLLCLSSTYESIRNLLILWSGDIICVVRLF